MIFPPKNGRKSADVFKEDSMKLYYIINARIPTEKAHGIQVMKM